MASGRRAPVRVRVTRTPRNAGAPDAASGVPDSNATGFSGAPGAFTYLGVWYGA